MALESGGLGWGAATTAVPRLGTSGSSGSGASPPHDHEKCSSPVFVLHSNSQVAQVAPSPPRAMVKVRWRAAPHVRVATRGGVRRIGLPSHARGRAPEVNPRGCERGHGDRHWAGHRHGLMLLGRGRGPLSV